MPLSSEAFTISVAARESRLSQVQVEEVLEELRKTYPQLLFEKHFTATAGDRDQKTSLRSLGKTDFFTAELDRMVLEGGCRAAIHSAKDLPDPLPEGLALIALTAGVDRSDVLVMREGETLEGQRPGARIATSSERREEMVRQLRGDVAFIDLRGTIDKRLKTLDTGGADGVVIAEAAIIRLGLTHLNRVVLPGETVEGQGQLAITARDDDEEMRELFACIDSRMVPA